MSLSVVDLSLFNDTDYKDIPNKLTAEIGNLGNVKKKLTFELQAGSGSERF